MTTLSPAEAAAAYLAAIKVGRRPLAEIGEQYGVSQSTASRRVSEARAAGLLPALDGPGLPGRNPTLLRVAAVLGVDPDALKMAVLEHANGRLVVSERS